MPKTHPPMKLSREELTFLRHWMFDETHFQDGPGAAKRLQVAHGATPADLAILIAAALPDPAKQEVAGKGPPPSATPQWPWSEQTLRARVAEAQAFLGQRQMARSAKVGVADS
jgi:hypothetical protein